MANPLGNPVARLVREIAYAKGEALALSIAADKKRARLALLATEFKRLRAECRAAKLRISELETALAQRADLPFDDIREIQHWPKRSDQPYGTIARELIRFLQAADGPLTLSAIVAHMVDRLKMPTDTAKDRESTRYTIRGRLRELAAKGAVLRLPDELGHHGQPVSCWRWKGL